MLVVFVKVEKAWKWDSVMTNPTKLGYVVGGLCFPTMMSAVYGKGWDRASSSYNKTQYVLWMFGFGS